MPQSRSQPPSQPEKALPHLSREAISVRGPRPGRGGYEARKMIRGVPYVGVGATPDQARDALLDSFYGRKETPRQGRHNLPAGLAERLKPPATVGELLDRFLEHIDTDRASKTYRTYESPIRLHIRPALGRVPLKSLTRPMCVAYLDSIKERNVATNTLNNAHKVPLSSALSWAVGNGWIEWNPVESIKVPTGKVGVRTTETYDAEPAPEWIPSEDEVGHFLTVCAERRDPLLGLWYAGFTLGPRPSELVALASDCFRAGDASPHQHISIHRQGQQISKRYLHRSEDGEIDEAAYRFFGPKGRFLRVLRDAPRPTIAMLEAQVKTAAALEAAHPRWSEEWAGLLWRNDRGAPIDPNGLNGRFHDRCDWAGWPKVRPYVMRHFCLSSMWTAGLPEAEIMAWAGHRTPKMLYDHYGHLLHRPGQRGSQGTHFEAVFGSLFGVDLGVEDSEADKQPG